MRFFVNSLTIELLQGDITEQDTVAITNAANKHLVLGTGVAGAIRQKGGAVIQQECSRIGHCEVGKAVITSGGNLKAKYVIHAVGPRMGEGDESRKLANAIRSVLSLAEDKQIESAALPAISTGVFGFPLTECAKIMAKEIIGFAFEEREFLQHIVVCLFGNAAYKTFYEVFMEALSKVDDNSKDATLLLDNFEDIE